MKIGFVDSSLHHSHSKKFLSLIREDLAGKGAVVVGAFEFNPAGDDWCAANGLKRFDSVTAIAAESDAFIVLAPNNAELHLEMCREVLPFGKPSFLDKTLSRSLEDAEEILSISEANDAPVMSSSSLPFSVELEELLADGAQATEVFAEGMGEWHNYGLHTVAMPLRLLGSQLRRVIDTGSARSRVVTMEFADGRRAHVAVRDSSDNYGQFPWKIGFRTGDGEYRQAQVQDYDGFYRNMISRVLDFFKSGETPFSSEQSLALVATLQAADRSQAAGGEWVDSAL